MPSVAAPPPGEREHGGEGERVPARGEEARRPGSRSSAIGDGRWAGTQSSMPGKEPSSRREPAPAMQRVGPLFGWAGVHLRGDWDVREKEAKNENRERLLRYAEHGYEGKRNAAQSQKC